MRKFIKRICIMLCMFCVFLLSACTNNSFAGGTVKYNFSVNANEVSLEVGEKFQIFATYGDEGISYTSLNAEVATVSATGEVQALAEGITFIEIKSESESTNVKVIVKNPEYKLALEEESSFVMIQNAPKTLSFILTKDGVIINEKLTFTCENTQAKITQLTNTSASVTMGEAGLYDVKITHESGTSLTVSIKVMSQTATKLSVPSASVSENKLVWTAVENASGYMVKLDGNEWTRVDGTSYDLAGKTAKTAYVYAVCDTFEFYDSESVAIQLPQA